MRAAMKITKEKIKIESEIQVCADPLAWLSRASHVQQAHSSYDETTSRQNL